MSTQSESSLENSLIKQLMKNGYERTNIKNEDELKKNFKIQLEKFNNIVLTDSEFRNILIHLESGTIFRKSEKLRDKFSFLRDNNPVYISFFNQKDYNKNIFQVANQISYTGSYETRYDVTILINGLPLLQIELKRRGGNIKKAFDQIKRYQKHSYKGLFNYVQLFVISNGVNTKYFANNKDQNYKFTFFWKDKDNKNIARLDKFTDEFLDPYKLSKMIAKYIVLNKTNKSLMTLRSYQYYAVEAIVDRALNTNLNGYVWHTTGSGKTLTSFKVSQILAEEAGIDKIIFVVDRKDLDYQTTKEFNSFADDSVDGTENTKTLIKQLNGEKNKLIITTIQKLNRAVEREREIKSAKDKKIILIFDECHRSQFGQMHSRITKFFRNLQYFGFTGTPIFAENANKNRTTHDIFGEMLHSYVIKDAIDDGNVLGFSVEYRGKYIKKTLDDKEVPGIDTKEFLESKKRLNTIADFIIEKHDNVTYNKQFNALFAVSSIDVLKKYYKLFKEKIKERGSNLKIATIFSFDANEDFSENYEGKHSRDSLEDYIKDYNKMFGSNYSTNDFGSYYVDLAKRFKDKEIDILIVVNMFLTGFDSKYLNTLYVDKNLEYHGLLQAYSRTNRILDNKKSQGNIICFRNLKIATDKAIALYSNDAPLESVLMKSYPEYVNDFNEILKEFREIVPSIDDVDNLKREEDKRNFIVAFGGLLKILNKLEVFTEFDYMDLNIGEQEFADYRSKYIEIYETTQRGELPKESILEDVEFEVDLIRKDDINVSYILNLMRELDSESPSFANDKINLLNLVKSSLELKSKLELIDEFITKTLPDIPNKDIDERFQEYVLEKRKEEFDNIVNEEGVDAKDLEELLEEFEYSKKMKTNSIKEYLKNQGMGLKERRKKINKIRNEIEEFVEKYSF